MKCSECCAKCCAVYILDDDDWQEIADNMNITFDELTKKYPNRIKPLGPVNFCTFLDLHGFKCTIYPYRPVMCSEYFCPDWEVE